MWIKFREKWHLHHFAKSADLPHALERAFEEDRYQIPTQRSYGRL